MGKQPGTYLLLLQIQCLGRGKHSFNPPPAKDDSYFLQTLRLIEYPGLEEAQKDWVHLLAPHRTTHLLPCRESFINLSWLPDSFCYHLTILVSSSPIRFSSAPQNSLPTLENTIIGPLICKLSSSHRCREESCQGLCWALIRSSLASCPWKLSSYKQSVQIVAIGKFSSIKSRSHIWGQCQASN